jgi:hypothetical protein
MVPNKLRVTDKCGNDIVELVPSSFSKWRRVFAATHGKRPEHIALLLRLADGSAFVVDTAVCLRHIMSRIVEHGVVACELLEKARPPHNVEQKLSDCDLWRPYAPPEMEGTCSTEVASVAALGT